MTLLEFVNNNPQGSFLFGIALLVTFILFVDRVLTFWQNIANGD
jgi:hypothetical protein